jgi:hypothetical protein
VNTNLTDSQDQPTVAVDTSGNFVVAWRSNKQDLSNAGVFARRYDAAGNPLTGEFQVNVNNSGSQDKPTIAISASGFVIAWSSGNNQDGDKHGIFARRFNTSGNPIGGEFLVNTRTTDEQDYPAIGMAADGSFTIAWSSNNQDGNSLGIYAQNFDASGTRVGGEYRVNGTTSGSQAQPAVGVGAYGDLAIVWQGPGVGDTSGVFGQSWAHPNAAPAVTVPTTQSVNEDTNLVFSTASGNAISVDDADAGSAAVRFTLTAINGMLTLASTAGITFITGDGTSDATMSVTLRWP